MRDKRLLNLCKESKKYIGLTVLMNWISVICNLMTIIVIGFSIQELFSLGNIENLNKNWYAKRKIAEGSRIMSLKINRQTNLEKLFDEIAPRFASRNGGYTRVIKTGFRRGDAAPLAIIEWVE